MPHPIIKISELTRVIIDFCLLLRNKRSLVSLACTCRALEEQALSTLWSEQSSLRTLIKSTLPPGIIPPSKPLPQPTNAEWDRFRRYASWMRRLTLLGRGCIPKEVFHLMFLGLSGEVVCPELWDLNLEADYDTLPFHHLLLSPKLTTLSFTYSSSRSPEEDISILQPVVMELDTFRLRDLQLQWWIPEDTRVHMESAASSAVLRCGPTLEKLTIFSPLSDAAVQHIMQLPNLCNWYAVNGPPRTPNLPLSDIFPRLDRLSLAEEISLEWLTLFTTTARHTPSGQISHPPLKQGPIERLTDLVIFPKVIIDVAFMSPIILFHGLVILRLTAACYTVGGCAFNLTDDDIAEIAPALPCLVVAMLGIVCLENSCRTTVASLASLSEHCRGLQDLEIHFNTANLRNDLDAVSADPRLDSLPSLRTCDVFHLELSNAPYTISEDDVVPVLRGFRRVFPSLAGISGSDDNWSLLSLRLPEVV